MDDSRFLTSYLDVIEGLPDQCAISITKIRRIDCNIVKRSRYIETMITEGLYKSHFKLFLKIAKDIQSFQMRKFEHAKNLRLQICKAHENFEECLFSAENLNLVSNLNVLANCAILTEKLDLNEEKVEITQNSISSPLSFNDSKGEPFVVEDSKRRKKRGRIPKKFKQEVQEKQQHEDVKKKIKKKNVNSKRIKGETDDEDTNEPLYCLCNRPSFGNMIECSNEHCTFEWFHFSCIGLKKRAPKGKWYCPKCRSNHRPKILKKEYRRGKI